MQTLHFTLSFFVNFHKINKMFLTILWIHSVSVFLPARKARRVSSAGGYGLHSGLRSSAAAVDIM